MDQRNERMESRMKMWRMNQEMLNSMGDKELRAFITGYMMAESKILRKLGSRRGCGCGCGCSCGDKCSCKGGSCKCDER